ncbi:hypothetical protein PsalN5692_01728 [Piscirickettsia salmonis]|uniref:hypothetical protein n=1 Tax=Piscirickettsia salmonis TaxID=1238 RepID=UPI0012B6DC55|nr:hypothetical protein [Piscirickettsia salmonis]QGP50266.1 hypothetical protein PsalN5692_01728 [Piscirickettsia salmonis]QGP54736.1 hypothetical protein PsalSR1_02177 [Piscirickettsia salmonis]QGP59367.1 hypothetical protein PsalBI1_01955 [Piscirickettsia salmonis]QGP64071.1 hypothetical protein PsalMR5_01936 [Piscirickettsia salmonis]
MITVFTLLLGHLVLMVGLRIFFGMYGSDSESMRAFLVSGKFKALVVFYFVFISCATVLPMVF